MAQSASTNGVGVHRLAGATVAATLFLIFVGGLVTNTGSALAVPDWPTTFGHNMFLYPWSMMVGGIFYEHTHRLLGSLVGFLTLSVAGWIWWAEPRVWVRRLTAVALLAVILQGVLGGMRVVLLADKIAIVHGCLAQAFLALMVGIATATSPWWQSVANAASPDDSATLRLRAFATAGLFYLQIVFGALLTHTGARLDFHLLVGGIATMATLSLSARILADTDAALGLHRWARLLLGLLVVQLCLGFGAMIVRFTLPGESFAPGLTLALPTLHRLIGAALVATSMSIAWRVARVTAPHSGLAAERPVGALAR